MTAIFANDSLAIQISVVVEPGNLPLSLEDATVHTHARATSGTILEGVASIVDADGGLAKAVFSAGSFDPGIYVVHFEVERAGERQTVLATRLRVWPS